MYKIKPFYTTSEVCEIFGVCRQTLLNWTAKKIIKPMPRRNMQCSARYPYAELKRLGFDPKTLND